MIADTDTTTTTTSSGVIFMQPPVDGAADILETAAANPHHADVARAIKLLLVAQAYYPDQYYGFIKDMEAKQIPWTLENTAFVDKLTEFEQRFQAVLNEAKVPEETINRAAPQDEVVKPLVAKLEALPTGKAELNRQFIGTLTQNYIDQSKEALKKKGLALENEARARQVIQESTEDLIKNRATRERITEEMPRVIERAVFFSEQNQPTEKSLAVRAIAPQLVAETAPTLAFLVTPGPNVADVTKAALTEAQYVHDKSQFVDRLVAVTYEQPELSPEAQIKTAAAQARLLEATAAQIPESTIAAQKTPGSPLVFFQLGESGAKQGAAKILDAVVSIMPAPIKEAILTRSLENAWNKITTNEALLTDYFGKSIAQSSMLKTAIQHGNQSFRERRGPAGIAGGLVSIISDVGGAFKSNEAALLRLEYERFKQTHIAKPGAHHVAHPFANVFEFIEIFHYVQQPEGFHIQQSAVGHAGQWVLERGVSLGLDRLGSSIAGNFATTAGAQLMKGGLGSLLSKIGLSSLGAVFTGGTSALAQAALWVGGNFLSKATNFLKKMIGGNEKVPLESTFFMAVAVVGVVIIFFVQSIFGFLNFPLLQNASLTSALVQNVGGGGEGDEYADVPLYEETPCVPGDGHQCQWPTSGCISQGPYTTSSHKGEASNAIDIGGTSGTTVISTIHGKVTDVWNRCADNTGRIGNTCGRGYGNYVVIQSNDGNTTLKYTHLSLGSMPEIGTPVAIGTPVGAMDHNGNSSGPHLHYQLNSAKHINSILPFSVPSCISSKTCDAILKKEGKSCQVSP